MQGKAAFCVTRLVFHVASRVTRKFIVTCCLKYVSQKVDESTKFMSKFFVK